MAKKSGKSTRSPISDGQAERNDSRPYIIQIDRPGQHLTLAQVRQLLAGTGVQLDEGYGPIPVNPALGRYVVRGLATRTARELAEKIHGVHFFGDTRIRPIGQPEY